VAAKLWSKKAQQTYLLSSFFIFCRDSEVITPIYEQPHREMCNELQECEPVFGSGIQHKKLYLAPRKTYKTSLVVAFIIYLILKYPNIRIAVGRATVDLARGLLFEVKQKLKNPIILEVFGDLSKEALIWAADQIVVNSRTKAWHEPTVSTFGLGTSLTGQHLDLIFGDDFVNENNYTSEAAQVAGRVTIQSMFPVLETHGSAVLTGTRWAANDLYGWIMDTDDQLEQLALERGEPNPPLSRQWKKYVRGVYLDDNTLYFPASLTEQFLQQQRDSMESKLFASWYLNQPFEEGMKLFPRICQRDFSYYPTPNPIIVWEDDKTRLVKNIPVYVTMTIDPALMSNPDNDEMGVVVNGTDADDIWWILHAEGFRAIPSNQASRIVYLIRQYQPKVVCLESAGADAEFTARLAVAINELNDNLDLPKKIVLVSYSALRDEAAGLRGKAQRIEALEPRFREYKAYLRRGYTNALYKQLNSWPNVLGNHDDVADACAMQRKVAKPAASAALVANMDYLEALEEEISWGPEGKQTYLHPGRALAQVGQGIQRLRA